MVEVNGRIKFTDDDKSNLSFEEMGNFYVRTQISKLCKELVHFIVKIVCLSIPGFIIEVVARGDFSRSGLLVWGLSITYLVCLLLIFAYNLVVYSIKVLRAEAGYYGVKLQLKEKLGWYYQVSVDSDGTQSSRLFFFPCLCVDQKSGYETIVFLNCVEYFERNVGDNIFQVFSIYIVVGKKCLYGESIGNLTGDKWKYVKDGVNEGGRRHAL